MWTQVISNCAFHIILAATVDVAVKPVKTDVLVKPPAPPSKPPPIPSVPTATAPPTLPTLPAVSAPPVSQASPARLPENLPDDVRNVALSLRTVAKQAGGNPPKFFGSNITKSLIRYVRFNFINFYMPSNCSIINRPTVFPLFVMIFKESSIQQENNKKRKCVSLILVMIMLSDNN
jgi:hypothetical protein